MKQDQVFRITFLVYYDNIDPLMLYVAYVGSSRPIYR